MPASTELSALTEAECWSLLRQHDLGRLALVVAGWPRIFPVNYAVADWALVFRTQPGSKLAHGPGSPACFEVDAYDERTAGGWSVMVVGILEEITGREDERSRRLRRLPVQPRAPGRKDHWVALVADEITGRSFRGGWIVPGHYLG